jgi:hypothetical protein
MTATYSTYYLINHPMIKDKKGSECVSQSNHVISGLHDILKMCMFCKKCWDVGDMQAGLSRQRRQIIGLKLNSNLFVLIVRRVCQAKYF